jgi:hypothetical protein
MKFTNLRGSVKQGAETNRPNSRRGTSPLMVAATALFMGLTLCGQATPALCATQVYVYMSGTYQDVSSEIVTTNGHTYVMTADPFEVVLDFIHGHVYDIDGDIIGFLQDDEMLSTDPLDG